MVHGVFRRQASSIVAALAVLLFSAGIGHAKQGRAEERFRYADRLTLRLADVVVESNSTSPAAPAAPVAATPVAVDSGSRKIVQTQVRENTNYMATIAWSAVAGAVLGAVVGAAIYYLDDGQRARNIGYWAAGGVLLGTAVGVTQVLVQEGRADTAVSNAPTDPAPTLRLALYRLQF